MRRGKPTLNITDQLEQILADLCLRLPELAHINPRRVLVCATRARRQGAGGIYAKIIPMRFPDGTPFHTVKGTRYALPQIPTADGDVLYLIYVYLPRFYEQPFERRVLTLVHELFHIAPAFDGTIRKFGARAHGNSREEYNTRLEPLVRRYLAQQPNGLLDVLRGDFTQLTRDYSVCGRALSLPKPVKLP